METQKQIHCIASNSYGTTGTHQNLLQDLSKSITRLEKIIHGTKQSNRDNVMVRYQASQIRKYAATQRYSDNQRTQVICC